MQARTFIDSNLPANKVQLNILDNATKVNSITKRLYDIGSDETKREYIPSTEEIGYSFLLSGHSGMLLFFVDKVIRKLDVEYAGMGHKTLTKVPRKKIHKYVLDIFVLEKESDYYIIRLAGGPFISDNNILARFKFNNDTIDVFCDAMNSVIEKMYRSYSIIVYPNIFNWYMSLMGEYNRRELLSYMLNVSKLIYLSDANITEEELDIQINTCKTKEGLEKYKLVNNNDIDTRVGRFLGIQIYVNKVGPEILGIMESKEQMEHMIKANIKL